MLDFKLVSFQIFLFEVKHLSKHQQKLLLIDGMGLLFRAFYATAPTGQFMINDQGIPTNGVYGMLLHMFTAMNHFQPSHVAVCWDMGSKTFRNDLFTDYKGNRKAPPEQLIPQFDLAKEAVAAFSIPNIGMEGYEADDCLGTIAHMVKRKIDVVILTGDHDLLQVLDDEISVALLKKGYGNYEVYTKDQFIAEHGYDPIRWIDIKALTGDPSDNYPGVKGIGPKTAEKLILEYNNIENMLQSLDTLKPGIRKKIEQDLDLLKLSKQLAAIKLDVPLKFSLNEALIDSARMKDIEQFLHLNIKGTTRILTMYNEFLEGLAVH